MRHTEFNLRTSGEELRAQVTGIAVIEDPSTIQRLYNNLVQSAKVEVILLLPTSTSFLREEKIGIIQSLRNAAIRGVNVKVMTPADEKIDSKIQDLFQSKEGGIELRRIRHTSEAKPSEARTKILVVDKKEYLVVELKDDSKETFVDAVRLAVYSATEATVKSYLALFESLWLQAELYARLEAHGNMQKEFINVAAHELRTPIQPLIGLIEVLDLNRGSAEEEEEEVRGITVRDARMIARNVLRLERLSQAILDSTRIESNSLKLNKQRLDLNEKIRNTIQDVRSTIHKNHNLEIHFEQTDKPIFVQADRVRILEVLSNILGNAVKFTAEGIIKVTLEKVDDSAIISIRDSGRGVDPEMMPKLFTRFTAGKDSRSGSGLGLYISKAIIEAHGGKIWAENNKDGKGATVSFSLPIA